MAGTPVHKMTKINARIPRGQEGIWRVICDVASKEPYFTVNDIYLACGDDKSTIRDYIIRLSRGGYIKHRPDIEPDVPGTKVYEVLRATIVAPRLRSDGSEVEMGNGQDRLWRSMKMNKAFTIRELALLSSMPKAVVSINTAADYVKRLSYVGYIIKLPNKPGKGPTRYTLIKNTGPRAPMIQRTKWVWDPNLRKVMGAEGETA